MAELWDGTQIGEPGLLNDDIFGVLALHQAGAPPELLRRIVDYLRTKQLPDGGWTWNASPGAPADTDMTGSVVAAFCAAGVDADDPDLEEALGLLHTLQDPATGGFIAPPESFGIGVNTDTTSWVTSGLIQCGIDPQGPEWTTAQGKTPLDYLVSMQQPDGHFDWTEEFDGGAFETFDSVRPLGGIGFSTAPPARLDGASPAVRPAAAVAAGTTVPITLVIDHGPGADDVRMCRVDVANGSGLGAVLADAKAASAPACLRQRVRHQLGSGRNRRLLARRGRRDPRVRLERPGRRLGARGEEQRADRVRRPRLPRVRGDGRRIPVRRQRSRCRRWRRWSGGCRGGRGSRSVARPAGAAGASRSRLRCPRGLGGGGCRGLLTAQFRKHRGGALLGGGSKPPSRSARAYRAALDGRRPPRRCASGSAKGAD